MEVKCQFIPVTTRLKFTYKLCPRYFTIIYLYIYTNSATSLEIQFVALKKTKVVKVYKVANKFYKSYKQTFLYAEEFSLQFYLFKVTYSWSPVCH